MNAWIFLSLAICANISCNVMLKKAMSAVTAEGPLAMATQALSNIWFWGGGISGMILLLTYLLAIRTLDLSVAYTLVTASALLGITIASILFLGEELSFSKIGGVVAIVSGMLLLARSQGI